MKVLRYVLAHKEMGVFLGQAMGMGFWSRLDPAGQDAAATFPTADSAMGYLDTWDPPPDDRLEFHAHPVEVELHGEDPNGAVYADRAACVAAGLPDWDPDSPRPRLILSKSSPRLLN